MYTLYTQGIKSKWSIGTRLMVAPAALPESLLKMKALDADPTF